jgi:hypothetical protein
MTLRHWLFGSRRIKVTQASLFYSIDRPRTIWP